MSDGLTDTAWDNRDKQSPDEYVNTIKENIAKSIGTLKLIDKLERRIAKYLENGFTEVDPVVLELTMLLEWAKAQK